MDDPEFRKMVGKALFALSVALVFAVPLFFIFKNRFNTEKTTLLDDINKEKSVFLYVTENNCRKCKTLKKELDNNETNYIELNKNKNVDYNEIINKLALDSSSIYTPTLIYIENGEVISYIVDIKSKEYLSEYIKDYK